MSKGQSKTCYEQNVDEKTHKNDDSGVTMARSHKFENMSKLKNYFRCFTILWDCSGQIISQTVVRAKVAVVKKLGI